MGSPHAQDPVNALLNDYWERMYGRGPLGQAEGFPALDPDFYKKAKSGAKQRSVQRCHVKLRSLFETSAGLARAFHAADSYDRAWLSVCEPLRRSSQELYKSSQFLWAPSSPSGGRNLFNFKKFMDSFFGFQYCAHHPESSTWAADLPHTLQAAAEHWHRLRMPRAQENPSLSHESAREEDVRDASARPAKRRVTSWAFDSRCSHTP